MWAIRMSSKNMSPNPIHGVWGLTHFWAEPKNAYKWLAARCFAQLPIWRHVHVALRASFGTGSKGKGLSL